SFCFFFFSSRRRHTRFSRDWSSDVCSSDLLTAAGVLDREAGVFTLPPEHALFVSDSSSPYYMGGWFDMLPAGYAVIDRVAEAARDRKSTRLNSSHAKIS